MLIFLLTFLPALVIHSILVIGVVVLLVGIFLGVIPLINTYQLPIELIGLVLFCLGLYLEGGVSYKNDMAKQLAQVNAKIAAAQTASTKTNTQIVTKLVTQTQVVHDKGATIVKYIQADATKIDGSCKLLPEVIVDLNNAAQIKATP